MTMKVMRTTRSALIYLLLAMEREESERAKAHKDSGLSMPMTLHILEDDYKRPY